VVVGLRTREAQKEVNRYEVARRTMSMYVVARCDEEVCLLAVGISTGSKRHQKQKYKNGGMRRAAPTSRAMRA
jgi:hypothetical protein